MAEPTINWELGPKTQWRDITGGQPTKFSIFHSSGQKALTIEPPQGKDYKPLTIKSDGTVVAKKFTGDGSQLMVNQNLSLQNTLDKKLDKSGGNITGPLTTDTLNVSSKTRGVRVNSWLDLTSSVCGMGSIGTNLYLNQSDNNWKWANTHKKIGGTAIQFDDCTEDASKIMFLRASGPSKADADATVSESMRIDHNGNVGIGITEPESKLHVFGSVKISDRLIPNYDSKWVPDNIKTSHPTVFQHNFNQYPSLITIYFSPKDPPRGAIYPLMWSWSEARGINPVTVEVDGNKLVLNIVNNKPLHSVWSARTGWVPYNNGFWRVLLWR